jgi:glucose/arabinose dehydrogenase/PKD repeat protein
VPGRTLTQVILTLLAGFFALFLHVTPATASVPAGFEEKVVASVPSPTALAFTPDGRMLVTSKPGQVWVYKGGALLQNPALDLSSQLCDNRERGLLGIAVDPGFGTPGNNYIYLYYNYKKHSNCDLNAIDGPVNRVSRFTMEGDSIDPTTEKVLIDNVPAPNGYHDGGDVKFGKDGNLYVSVGDGSCDYLRDSGCGGENDAARDKHVLLGKILRITPDGTIPAGNPFMGASSEPCGIDGGDGRTDPGKVCQETFAWGLRNPFRMAFNPDAAGTSFRIHDVGQATWEEINRGQAGADYGWNCREGADLNPFRGSKCRPLPGGTVNPIHAYNHKSGCESVTGGTFVPDGAWPASFDRAYLFGDYVCNKIFKLMPTADGGFHKTVFAGGLGPGGPIAMTFGPSGTGESLYYTTFDKGGQVRRIAPIDGNQAPVADIGDNQLWSETLTINFNGSDSHDPDNNMPLTYLWDFDNDGTSDKTTPSPTTSHTYATAGKYTATLTVTDSLGKPSAPDTIEVFPGNTPPPRPVIVSPADGSLFRVGESLTLMGSATDAEDDADGNPSTAPTLEWEVLQWHDGNHTHPFASRSGNNQTFLGPPPEELASTDPAQNYLEIRLTAKDSQGLSSETVVRALRPRTVDVSFKTLPINLKLRVNGVTFRAPRTLLSWAGYELNVSALRQKDRRGRTWAFSSWSDGGTRDHTITTPDTNATYTATFRKVRR